jgi:hypothetical protein
MTTPPRMTYTPPKGRQPYQHKRAAAIVRGRQAGITFAELARRYGVTSQRIQQIHAQAIQRLVEASGELSSRQIAEAIGCHHMTVDVVRKELDNYPPATRKGKDGKQYPAKPAWLVAIARMNLGFPKLESARGQTASARLLPVSWKRQGSYRAIK